MSRSELEIWHDAAIANRDRADLAEAAYSELEQRYEAERARADRLAAALRREVANHPIHRHSFGGPTQNTDCGRCETIAALAGEPAKEEA